MAIKEIEDLNIKKGLEFVDKLRSEKNRYQFWETLDPDIDHKIWSQSQYLAFVLFTVIGMEKEAKHIQENNDFNAPAGDREGRANDRFCVLIDDSESFAYKRISAEAKDGHADSIALMGMYSLVKERRGSRLTRWLQRRKNGMDSHASVDRLRAMYDQEKGFLIESGEIAELYKLSLLGILAKKIGNREWVDTIDNRLRETQSNNGGWKSHWIGRTEPRPIGTTENLETTALSIIALYLSLNRWK